MTKYKFDTTYS